MYFAVQEQVPAGARPVPEPAGHHAGQLRRLSPAQIRTSKHGQNRTKSTQIRTASSPYQKAASQRAGAQW